MCRVENWPKSNNRIGLNNRVGWKNAESLIVNNNRFQERGIFFCLFSSKQINLLDKKICYDTLTGTSFINISFRLEKLIIVYDGSWTKIA